MSTGPINHKPAHVFERFRRYQLGQLALSSISAAELASGVEKSGSSRNRLALQKFLAPLDVIPFAEDSIWHYAQLRHQLQQQGTRIGNLDMLVAAHALALDTILISNNIREFARIPNLKLENWV